MQDILTRPIAGDWPHLSLDASYVKVREGGRIVPVAVSLAVGVNRDGRREVPGMAIGASEAETFRLDFLRSLTRRGLGGVKLVISDAHEGLKAAVTKVLRAKWQRCRVHVMRNATARAGKTQRRLVSAIGRLRPTGTAFAEADAPAAHARWRRAAAQLRPKVPRRAERMDAAEHDVRACMDFPREHHAKIHSDRASRRRDQGPYRRRRYLPGRGRHNRLLGASLLEPSDEWASQRARCRALETIGSVSHDPTVSPPPRPLNPPLSGRSNEFAAISHDWRCFVVRRRASTSCQRI